MEKKVVLVVDDSWETVESINICLKQINANYEIIHAPNGKSGIEIAKKEVPDLIIMDWDMPVLNGIDAIRQLKTEDLTAQIPVIMATGTKMSSYNLKTALSAGAVDFVRKPIDFIELEARLNACVRISEQQRDIKRLLENEIDIKNRKLSTTSMLVAEKNELLQDFNSSLSKLLEKTIANSTVNADLKTMIKQIEKHLELDSSWDTFKVQFEEVHSGFFTSLKELYAEISHKDTKLCTYMKLGIENKEMAQLLNISPASVSTSLYRLKKKLNIERELDLRDFIQQLE